MKIKRFDCNPIIHLGLSETLDGNINGPSLIEAPDWLPDRLGKYYLYFAHHIGSFIRLAYSDRLEGPWSIYEPGTLHIEQSHCYNHVASPDIHVDDARREIRMYYHGWVGDRVQRTKVAVSRDGLHLRHRRRAWASHISGCSSGKGTTTPSGCLVYSTARRTA